MITNYQQPLLTVIDLDATVASSHYIATQGDCATTSRVRIVGLPRGSVRVVCVCICTLIVVRTGAAVGVSTRLVKNME